MKAASYARQEGALFLATNEDTHLPMDVPYVVPGQGLLQTSKQLQNSITTQTLGGMSRVWSHLV